MRTIKSKSDLGSVAEWVWAPDLYSGGPGFKSRSGHNLELFLGTRVQLLSHACTYVNSQLVCLLPVGILNFVMHLNYLLLPVCWIIPENPLSEIG